MTNNKPKTRIRLVKVIVQPVIAEDDGEALIERVIDPVAVSSVEWPEFPEKLAAELKGLEEKANGDV